VKMHKFALVDCNFLLLEKQFYLLNEITVSEYEYSCLDVDVLSSTPRSQTFHIQTEPSVLQFARERYPEQIAFNEYNFHAIPADYGGISYTGFCNQFNREIVNYTAIFTKGTQKVAAIKAILSVSGLSISVYNLETFFCPPIPNLINQFSLVRQVSCFFHVSDFHFCSAYKVGLYAKWLKENHAKMDRFWSLHCKPVQAPTTLLPPDYFLYTQPQQIPQSLLVPQQQQQQILQSLLLPQQQQQQQQQSFSNVQWHTPSHTFP
jgi:hypothetical protein